MKLKPVPIEEIDTTNTDPKYWEEILRREGLTMDRGMFPHASLDDLAEAECPQSG